MSGIHQEVLCARESTSRRLAVIYRSLREIEVDFAHEYAEPFRRDLLPDPLADYVLANPTFNYYDWFRKDDDVSWRGAPAEKEQPVVDPQGAARQRRQFGVPPKGNANFAWVQHFIATTPRTALPASSSPMAACPPTSPAKAICGAHRGRPRGLHGRLPGQLFDSTPFRKT